MRAANVTRVNKWDESRRYYFNNGYGASVIRGPYTFGGRDGLWEADVMKRVAGKGWQLCYDTPITSDGIGYLSEVEVDALLDRIEKLPKSEEEEWTDS